MPRAHSVGTRPASLIETYRITGLLHDFDYEKYPSAAEHPFVGNKILAEQGWPEEVRAAILGHAQYSGVARDTHLAKALFACDELAGFLTAVSLVKPTKSIFDVDVQSVRKKLKDKAFARGVHREDIIQGAQELGVDLDAHITFCIAALRRHAVRARAGRSGRVEPALYNFSPSEAGLQKRLNGDRFRLLPFSVEIAVKVTISISFFGLIPVACPLTVMGRDRFLARSIGTIEVQVRASVAARVDVCGRGEARAIFALQETRFYLLCLLLQTLADEEASRSHFRVIGVCDSFRAAILF